jgi:hypothetical protein
LPELFVISNHYPALTILRDAKMMFAHALGSPLSNTWPRD